MVEPSSTAAAAPASTSTDAQPPRKKRPRPNRWGDAPPAPASTTTAPDGDNKVGGVGGGSQQRQPRRSRFSSAPPPPPSASAPILQPPGVAVGGATADGRTKAAALQQSIAARLAALKQKRGLAPAAAVPTAQSSSLKRPASSVSESSTSAPSTGTATAKRAKVYDPFAISTKKPTEEDEQRAKDMANPYLSTYRDPNAPTPDTDADKEEGTVQQEEEEEVLLDGRLAGGRSEKRRARYKPLKFVEPGTFVEIAERKRERAANAAKSGFASGRKVGTYVRPTGMAQVSADEILKDDKAVAVVVVGDDKVKEGEKKEEATIGPLPLRADEDPSNPPPLAVEWWDAELLPSKLRRELAAREKRAMAAQAKRSMELDSASAAILGPAAAASASAATSAKMGAEGNDDDGGGGDGGVEESATGGSLATDGKSKEDDSSPPRSSDDDTKKMLDRCFRHADISNSKTSTLVQHPAPVEKPAPPPPPAASSSSSSDAAAAEPQPKKREAVLHLTKKEMKRQRKLRRAERQRELQDRQAAGLEPPPEPRLTLSNFMRVLGDQAVVDPSKMESVVLEQIRSRKLKHERMNEERKLTPEQRRSKKIRKLAEDTTDGVSVALFYVRDASHRYHRTKIDLNAQQNNVTGGVVECEVPGLALVVAEGGPKAIGRYVRLMTVRMKWRGENFLEGEGDDEDEGGAAEGGSDEEMDEGGDGADAAYGGGGGESGRTTQKFNPDNVCELVWTGMSVRRNFNSFVFQSCPTADVARKVLEAKGVAHYWDRVLAVHERRMGGAGAGAGAGGGGGCEADVTFNLKLGGGGDGGGARNDHDVN